MNGEEVNVKFGADIGGLKDGAAQASSAFNQSTSQISNAVSSLNQTVSTQMKEVSNAFSNAIKSMASVGTMLGGVIASVHSVSAMKGAIEGALSYNAAILQLSRVMGQTTEQASVLATAIKIIGGTTEEFISINMKLGMHIKSNADQLEELGVVLKDSNGHLLSQQEIFGNAIKAMGEYKAGADQDLFALSVFGRACQDVYKYQQLNNDMMARATEVANRYGLVIGDAAAVQTRKFSQELAQANMILDAIKVKVGNELIPQMVKLGGWFSKNSEMINVFVVAIKVLISIVTDLIVIVKAVILPFRAVFDILWGLSQLIGYTLSAAIKVLRRDFTGAMKDIFTGADKAKKSVLDIGDAFKDIIKTYQSQESLWAKDNINRAVTGGASPTSGTKTMPVGKTGAPEEENLMAKWRQELEQKKMDEKAYFDFSIEQEKAFWQSKIAETEGGSKKQLNLRYEVLHQIFELEKRDAQQTIRDQEHSLDTDLAIAEKSVAAKKAELDKKYQLGQISATQQINGEIELQNQLYLTQQDILKQYETLAEKYPQIWQKVQDDIRKITEKNNEEIVKLNTKLEVETQKEWQKILQPIETAFSSTLSGMLKGTETFQQGLQKIFSSILDSFINTLVKKMVNEWLMGELQKLNISQMFSNLLIALGITTAAETSAAKKAIEIPDAIKTIETNAATAASGAASAEASIPYVGPALAAAAAAAMMAMVMGYTSMVSAAGGYDVPSGVNPMTQLHSSEMVLPADLAGGVRNMIAGGGGGGNQTIYISAIDTKSWTSREGRKILKGLRGPARNMGIRI